MLQRVSEYTLSRERRNHAIGSGRWRSTFAAFRKDVAGRNRWRERPQGIEQEAEDQ